MGERPRPGLLAMHFNMEAGEINEILTKRAYEGLANYYENYKGNTQPDLSKVAKQLGIGRKQAREMLKKYRSSQNRKRQKESQAKKKESQAKKNDKVVKYYESFAVSERPSRRVIAAHFGRSLASVRRALKCHEAKKAALASASKETDENAPVVSKKLSPKVWHHDKVLSKTGTDKL